MHLFIWFEAKCLINNSLFTGLMSRKGHILVFIACNLTLQIQTMGTLMFTFSTHATEWTLQVKVIELYTLGDGFKKK